MSAVTKKNRNNITIRAEADSNTAEKEP